MGAAYPAKKGDRGDTVSPFVLAIKYMKIMVKRADE
jgi:hypothetical protein